MADSQKASNEQPPEKIWYDYTVGRLSEIPKKAAREVRPWTTAPEVEVYRKDARFTRVFRYGKKLHLAPYRPDGILDFFKKYSPPPVDVYFGPLMINERSTGELELAAIANTSQTSTPVFYVDAPVFILIPPRSPQWLIASLSLFLNTRFIGMFVVPLEFAKKYKLLDRVPIVKHLVRDEIVGLCTHDFGSMHFTYLDGPLGDQSDDDDDEDDES